MPFRGSDGNQKHEFNKANDLAGWRVGAAFAALASWHQPARFMHRGPATLAGDQAIF